MIGPTTSDGQNTNGYHCGKNGPHFRFALGQLGGLLSLLKGTTFQFTLGLKINSGKLGGLLLSSPLHLGANAIIHTILINGWFITSTNTITST